MALDGITIAALTAELNSNICNSRINKIVQPEKDELLLTLKTTNGQQRLCISANASLPFLYLTDTNKQAPLSAPSFCMLLRKHLSNGRIVKIEQPSLERIIIFTIEHLNEMGDLCSKKLVIELMGKHSNIIFLDSEDMIIDSIKHVSSAVSSVREVLPGRHYFIPMTQEKFNPFTITEADFITALCSKPFPVSKAIYTTLTGFSPIMAEELSYKAHVASEIPASELSKDALHHIYEEMQALIQIINSGNFEPNIIHNKKAPVDFAPLILTVYSDCSFNRYNSISDCLVNFYEQKSIVTRIKQKSVDLRKIVQTALERNVKKYDLQLKQLKDTEKMDKYRIYGELINTYGYNLKPGLKSFVANNYYTGEDITIPLDSNLSAMENSKKYFDKYGKLKRTKEAVTIQIAETKSEIEHLKSIENSLNIALLEADLTEIKDELIESGYIKKKSGKKMKELKSKPFHYVTEDNFHIYVGKNNYQNDYLTFKFANGNDWWFHAKGIPGSHVIVKSEGKELPDKVFEEAGALAAYYSSGRNQDKVEIDYVLKKEVKKPSASKPGFVVYYTNYSLIATPTISSTLISE